ncbi:Anthocyanidin 5,3-O-glucosyltransferase [Triticum urartu]|uniref:Glycosyltransferase n=1 Tax=Triticum urartu TaxID=4572 RepID=M8A5D7_TRIUA|nr:Anthocyanidin 5,3-O-glucosyltransferase [Triticum urartu]
MTSRPTVVLVPSWGSGHFMSALEAGKRLLATGRGAFTLTVLVMHAPSEAMASEVQGHVRREAASGLDIRFLQLPAVEHPTGCVDPVEFASRTVDVPGLPPVPPSYMPACLVKAKIQSYDWFEYHGRRFMEARGVIVNTSVELESSILAAIADGQCVPGRPAPALHAIGPVVWFGSTDDQQPHECVRWLDAQPPASVVFLCFGSMGSLDAAQVREVAAGLERSGHRFLWVLRGPPVAGTRLPTDANLDEVLPEGFLEATAGRGLVWPAWAPQREILSHAAVGGFVTHCGWNSILESLWSGVPMIPWPLYGEQHLNAFELVAGVGAAVALEMDRRKGFFVEAAELERAVRSLMGGPSEEGRKARRTAAETSAACRKAVGEGGSSCAALQRLVGEILVLPKEGNDSR